MKDLQAVLRDWEAVIGLEVHTELTTLKTKMFCSCPIEFGAEPNTHVCPVCLGMPGALPVPNRAAIESIVLAGLATGCEIMKRSMFYRKNYFYPDMSKNFQTTQGPVAFCMNGSVELEVGGNAAKERAVLDGTRPAVEGGGYLTLIGITRIHMEEDAGKMIHVGGADGRITGATHSLVDYNRCGTPLIELVTEPDLRTPEEARIFLQKLRQIYLTLAISDCSMEEGSLRCDGNVSLRPRGSTALGTKTELKNMNSFKNLHDGLAYEICRQAEVLEGGGAVLQETRHWEPASKRTVSMRVKETADDYRLFPEPDLAPYDLTEEFIEGVRVRLPELPDAKKRRYIEDFGLPAADAANLAGEPPLSAFFEESVLLRPALAKPIANFLLNDVAASLNTGAVVLAGEGAMGQVDETGGVVWSGTMRDVEDAVPYGCGETIAEGQHNRIRRGRRPRRPAAAPSPCPISSPCPGRLTPAGITELVQLMADDTISSKQAKEVFALMTQTGETPGSIVEQHGMRQVSDVGAIEAAVEQVLAANPEKVAEYRDGKTGLLGFFVGQMMKATGGQGNPRLINEILRKHLDA